MHTHFSAVSALSTFFAVLVLGTIWRLIGFHLAANSNATLSHAGRAMLFQY
jgi:hypothetical protein